VRLQADRAQHGDRVPVTSAELPEPFERTSSGKSPGATWTVLDLDAILECQADRFGLLDRASSSLPVTCWASRWAAELRARASGSVDRLVLAQLLECGGEVGV